jgi:hypothetical protein
MRIPNTERIQNPDATIFSRLVNSHQNWSKANYKRKIVAIIAQREEYEKLIGKHRLDIAAKITMN